MLARLFSRTRKPSPFRSRTKVNLLNLELLESREVPATLYGLTNNNMLASFDSATPGIVTTTAITGLGANQTLVGIDFRPRTGQLVGSAVATGSANNSIVTTYSINPLTGAATLIGATAAALAGAGQVNTGYDFNPTVDRIRFVNVNDENARLTPVNGLLAGDDTDLTPSVTSEIIAIAYDRNTNRQNNPGDTNTLATTLYAINANNSSLAIIGGLNGTPSPNAGAVTSIGALGITLDPGTEGGFDIIESALNNGLGTAFASLTVGGVTRLYSIELATGTATAVGTIGSGTTQMVSLAAAPDGVIVAGAGIGAGTGSGNVVRLFDPVTAAVRQEITPYSGFIGAVRVAAGDVNRDGIADAITAAVAPQGHVKVFDGTTGTEIGSFLAFQNFQGTVNIAAGDINRDGFSDVMIIANGANGHVKVFSGANGSELTSFFAFGGFLGDVTIAAADFDNNGIAEIVTVASLGGHKRVFNPDGTLFAATLIPNFVNNFLAFEGYVGAVSVAAGDVDGDGIADTVVSSGAGTRGHVKAFSSRTGQQIASFFAFGTAASTGAGVALADANRDGLYDIHAVPGIGQQSIVSAFDLTGQTIGTSFVAFSDVLGGASIGGVRY